MELKVFRDILYAGGGCCTVKAEIPVETEILISDYLPQVFKIVKCFARPVVLQKQLQPGKLTLEGYIRCTVYYQGEDGAGLCQTEQKIPFNKALDLPSFSFTSWNASVEGETEYINCRAVNPRRIEVRGAYGLVASVSTQCSTEAVTALADCGIQQRQATLRGVKRAAVLDKLMAADGTVVFDQPPAAILDVSGSAVVGEMKILNGKAVVKGEIHAQCAWRAKGSAALLGQAATIPFNQILDVEGLTEDCLCQCAVEPVGFAVAEGEDGSPGKLTATSMLHLRAWRPYELNCVTDAFSTQYQVRSESAPLTTEQLACKLDDTAAVTCSGPLPDENTRLLACFVAFGPAAVEQREDGPVLTARVLVTAFGQNSLDEIDSYDKSAELTLPLPVKETGELIPECWLSAQDVQAGCAGGNLEVTVTVRAQGAVLRRESRPFVSSIEIGDLLAPADPDISLRVYYAQPGEELFDIARRFHVSPGQMLEANGLEPDTRTLAAARRLLVPGA
ncbi:SPOCS domain-containing protein [Faecalibacterium sp. An122]|uniref:DUF3794 and LysM peptidoglycan-binding domain-containing protein n=1 Tax=Faecalibacterium sp. An122 TaxID=1965551 RepID=UPI000B366556|nr:SPOCS domain-containing protein [Faecalibacterium sp. An122]OUQ35056.1 hypothetical protein B5E67_12480 [Faecalibacterium sp. An122]